MISADLVRQIALEHKVDPGIVEKDYVLSKTLSAFAETEDLKKTLIFKGATALKKFYYPNWRYSEDLDFTSQTEIAAERTKALFERLASVVTEKYGVVTRVIEYSQYPRQGNELMSAQLKLGYDGPLHKTSGFKNNIRIDIAFDETIVGKVGSRSMLHTYPDDGTTVLSLYSLEEIIAEKLRSILQRGKSRDYYDIWLLLKKHQGDFSAETTREILKAKCRHKGIPEPTVDDFFQEEQVQEASRFWERGLAHQLNNLPD